MKRLFLTFGLVIAFFFTAQLSAATIFDGVTFQPPKVESRTLFTCVYKNSAKQDETTKTESIDACMALVSSNLYTPPSKPEPLSKGDKWHTIDNVFKRSTCTTTSCEIMIQTTSYEYIQIGTSGSNFTIYQSSPYYQVWGKASNPQVTQSISCPPDAYPNYIFERDSNNDGKPDYCYNPDELDNASNCANQVGSMLPALTNLATRVCKTDPETGASCGYSKKDGDIVYKTDLEMNCFGDGEKVPEYDPEPMPQPDKCAKYNDQLMVCKADPKEKCDALGNCGDQCGFVNKELFCFIECTGADCDKETPPPPVNCETNPTAPVCVEEPEPDPEFCKANPTDPKCTAKPPEPCTGDDCGSTGGGGQKVDLKPVVDQLKDLNKKLDFKTSDKSARTDFGGFSDLFSNSDIQAIKKMTDAKKDEITQQITTIKSEFKDMFEVTAVGGAYSDITLSLSMGDFHPQFWTFIQANIGIIGAIVMALAYLMAIRVIAE